MDGSLVSGPLLVLSSREKCFLFRVWNEGRLESELCLETTPLRGSIT